MINKQVLQKSTLAFQEDFPGLSAVNIMGRQFPIDPFLVFTEFLMDKPVFGPHPHAGVSVMTYILPDSKQGFTNRDSLGDHSYIEPGGIHVTQAGSGMFHDEFPRVPGLPVHGFQIWLNHKETDRMVTPKSMHAAAREIPEILHSDYKLRILHGEFNDAASPYSLVTPFQLFHIFLEPGKSLALDAATMAFVYGLKGSAMINTTNVAAQTLVTFNPGGSQVQVNAGNTGFEFMYATATPIDEPIVYGGPFVMTTSEQMKQTQHRLANGEMGNLKP